MRRRFDSLAELPLEQLRDARWDDQPAVIADAAAEFGSGVMPLARSPLPSLPPDSMRDDWDRDTDVSRCLELRGPSVPPVARRQAALLRMDSSDAGALHPLDQLPCRIGRHPTCEVRIVDNDVSRLHAQLVPDGEGHAIEDLGAQNGVFVQGRRVSRCRLQDGDWIQLGPRVQLRYSVTDQSERQLLERLYESSSRDPLTGAHTRQYFASHLSSEISFAARHESPVSLMLIDIDHFKRVNDTYGHAAGDAVLRQVSKAMLQRLRAPELLARYGGEEFAVCVRGADVRSCTRIAERLRQTVAALPVLYDKQTIPVTVSIGCASLSCASRGSADELFLVADRRLYSAKRGGRNQVVSAG
jgi:diguanylate cyclase (GGDEF)-like protein